MSERAQTSRLAVLMFTDLVGSVDLKSRLGTMAYANLLGRHDAIFNRLLGDYPGTEILQDTGDGYFAAFATVSDAIRHALRFQEAMHDEPWGPQPLRSRVGIHFGELAQLAATADSPPKVVGIAADLTSRLMSLASGGQILLTRAAFDEARQFVGEYPVDSSGPDGRRRVLRWMAHGEYVLQGVPEPIHVFEVGGEGIAPLTPPRDGDKARRSATGRDAILGWRPAVGLNVPQSPAWALERKLGEGTFGEVWLARHLKLKQHRVFKFCFDPERLESFKRELTLFRLLRDALGDRPDIARLYDVCLDRPPYFLESEYAPGGNLHDWANAKGGLQTVPLETRLQIVIQICEAVAAAHSVGVLHKDIKPSNVLMHVDPGDTLRPQLADFGIGLLTDHGQLAARQITEAGFTMMTGDVSSRTGTRMYAPPESLTGRPFTTQGDIYAIGVLLYQMVIADLERPLALGWERGIDDELLREDIAACVDGDPERRVNSAAEVASRLRRLPQRRQQRADDARRLAHAMRRRRLLRVVAVVAGALCVLSWLSAVAFFRERRLRVEAQTAYASAAVDQGVALHLAGQGQRSREAFLRARAMYQALGTTPLPADVGFFRSLHGFDAPVNTIPDAHPGGVMATAWLPDGVRVVSGGEDAAVCLWDARTGQLIHTFQGHSGLVAALAVSPDGKRLLSGASDETMRLWDIETGTELAKMNDTGGEVRGVAFSPDGRLAVSGSFGRAAAVRVWDLDTRAAVRSFAADRPTSYYHVSFSPDGRHVLATTYANHLWVWDMPAGDAAPRQPLQLKGHSNYVVGAAYSPDGSQILSASFDATLQTWDAATGAPLRGRLRGHTEGVRGVVYVGRDGTRALSCSMDGTLKLWDVASGEVIRTFAGHVGGIKGVAVSPDGRFAASGGSDGTLRVWDLASSHEVPTWTGATTVTSLYATPDGRAIVSGDKNGTVAVLDLATLRPLHDFDAHERPIECATPLADGRRLFTADNAGEAKLWDLTNGKLVRTFRARAASDTVPATGPATGPTSQPNDAMRPVRAEEWRYTAVSADGRVAVTSAAARGELDVWSPESAGGETIRSLGPQPREVTCLAVSADGSRALTGDGYGTLYCWDLSTGQLAFQTPEPEKRFRLDCVAFSPDGKTALAGGHDLVIGLWDLSTGKQLKRFEGHSLFPRAVGFGRDGATAFSAGSDSMLRMFDVRSGLECELDARLPAPLTTLAIVPPGDAVIVASKRMVSVWDISRAGRYIEDEPQARTACRTLRDHPADAAALRTLGEWYAFRGVDEWAVDLLEHARAAGDAAIPTLTLAHCYWRLGRPADAAREFDRALDRAEAPAGYLHMAMAVIRQTPARTAQAPDANTTRPATPP